MTDLTTITGDGAVDTLETDPFTRAEQRLTTLRTSFSTVVQTVGAMYRDEDWRYLKREDGSAYESMTAVLMDVLEVSAPMARRYIQGARDLYLPLAGLLTDGATIEVKSGDIAALGKDGMESVVVAIAEQIEGVTDPDEQSQIVADTITRERETRDAARAREFTDDGGSFDPPAPGESHRVSRGITFGDDDEGDEEFVGDDFTHGEPPARTNTSPRTSDEDLDPWEHDPSPSTGSGADTGAASISVDDDAASDAAGVDLTDPAQKVLDGAVSYRDPEALTGLDEPLQSVVAALVTLADMDPDTLAQHITYETRGALEPIEDALHAVSRFRARVETSPWFLARM